MNRVEALWKRVYCGSPFHSPDPNIFQARVELFFSNSDWSGKKKTHRFLTHNHSQCPVSRLLKRLHFCQINFLMETKMTVFAILIGKKTSCLLPRKELRQIEPKMRCFCISTTEIRERLWFKMRMELRQTTKNAMVIIPHCCMYSSRQDTRGIDATSI